MAGADREASRSPEPQSPGCRAQGTPTQQESSAQSGETTSADDDDQSAGRRPALRSQLGSGRAAGLVEAWLQPVFGRNMPVPRNENIYMESFRSRTASSVKLKRDRQQSSVYDPFAGMKTPGQRELITLQERVKLGMISVDEAVLEFKEWQLNQKRRSDSFRYQQENLRRLRDSINRRRDENKKTKNSDIEITRPIPRGKNRRAVQDYGIYEQASSLVPSQVEISRGNWKTDSTSSTASSNSNRSSTRSTLSLSSGREGDNEEELPDELPEERPRYSPRHASLQEERPPPRPPRIQNHSTRRSKMSSSGHSCRAPPVPPRGNN